MEDEYKEKLKEAKKEKMTKQINVLPYDRRTIEAWMEPFDGHKEHRPVAYDDNSKVITCSCGDLLDANGKYKELQ